MVDSDEEYERRNRDKFRHERNDYDQKDDRSRGQNRSNWPKNSRDRKDDRVRRRSPPRNELSPQNKRIRRDFRDNNYQHYDHSYPPLMHGPPHMGWSSHHNDPHALNNSAGKGSETEFPTQPPMLSFKHFLATQDDNITDAESICKYNKYKQDFKKEQIKEFFAQHKEEEWFRSKYHPEEYTKRQEEIKESLERRCKVFESLDHTSLITALNMNCSEKLIKLLDSAVILMEGGTKEDLVVLDIKDDISAMPASAATPATTTTILAATTTNTPASTTKASSVKGEAKSAEAAVMKADGGDGDGGRVDGGEKVDGDREQDGGKTDELKESGMMEEDKEEEEEKDEDEKKEEKKDDQEKDKMDGKVEKDTKQQGPRPLHKTQSIFLRNLVPSITKQEVESVCKRYPGYMRLSIQDPQPERRFVRRGWITFDRTVNVKDICWNLNNLRLRDHDMGAIVNRELRQRVRPVNGLTVHKTVARQDIKHAAKIIQQLDDRWQLWAKDTGPSQALGFISNNPVLSNITDFLVDEVDYEEELLGGEVSKEKEAGAEVCIEKDEELLKVLDRMLLYLRVVYSIDYYGAFEYQNEDDMPHRCGIVHARGLNTIANITNHDVNEWMSSFEVKLKSFLEPKFKLVGEEAEKIGLKREEDEVEKFITSNIQELGKDKWLCPLSGKKFKGPEFVRKHIMTKHLEKIEEVKGEVAYFNNFLSDPRRIHLPEHPSAKVVAPPQMAPMVPSFTPFYRPPPAYPGMYTNHFSVRAPDTYRRDMPGMMRRDKGRLDPRPIIAYTDLDAPEID